MDTAVAKTGGKAVAAITVAGTLIALQFVLGAFYDLMSAFLLFGVGYAFGRWGR